MIKIKWGVLVMKKINYVYDEEFKTDKGNNSKEELINIFNEKYFSIIKKLERENLITSIDK